MMCQDQYLETYQDRFVRTPSVWEVSMAFPDCRTIAIREAYLLTERMKEDSVLAEKDPIIRAILHTSQSYNRLSELKKYLKITKGSNERSVLDIPKAKSVLIETLYDFGAIRKSGARLHVRCPFHGADKYPSMVIYNNNNTYHCFGCQRNGSSIDFVMELHGLTFRQAVEYLNRG
jgi:hypothetical protein